jgi:uncharacterized OsmC-like protein
MLNAYDAHPAGAPDGVQWSARVRLTPGSDAPAVAYLRDHSLRISAPVSFKPSGEPAPSALEALLAALGTELATGFAARARRAGLILDALEVSVLASLENPLVAAGVIGEEGSPALAAAALTLYVASPESEETLRAVCEAALAAAPVYATLSRACPVTVTLKLTL